MNKSIVFGHPLFDVKTGNDIAWYINGLTVDMAGKVVLSLEQHGTQTIKRITLTIEQAVEMGFINPNALLPYLKT